MAIKNNKSGFALLVAIIFMSVMLSFGLALGSLGYKQQVLASGSIESQHAFYAADTGLECALYGDQQLGLFAYANHGLTPQASLPCGTGASVIGSNPGGPSCYNDPIMCPQEWVSSTRLSLNGGTRCADVTMYKPMPNIGKTTWIFSQGYDVSCATVANPDPGARFVSRGISTNF